MALWLVRAGKDGEREDWALEQGVAVIGWEELPDLSSVTSWEALLGLLETTYSEDKPKTRTNWASQIWPFVQGMVPGDLVALPLKGRSTIALGRVAGPYHYRADLAPEVRHARAVQWHKEEFPRTAFDQDLLYSLGAFMTVCRIRRNNAEERIRAMLEGKTLADPLTNVLSNPVALEPTQIDMELAPEQRDFSSVARDQIRARIGEQFQKHDLEMLVEAVLQAQGYKTQRVDPGPDGGRDILAGSGPMGFDAPRLCVQVKSSKDKVDVKVARELEGVMTRVGAQQGLLVAWGGFTKSALKEANPLFFRLRLWDADDLLDALLEHYERLPETLRAKLPLQRVWMLIQPEGKA